MKMLYTLGWLGTGMSALVQAEDTTEMIDLPARRQSVVTMREHIAMREARLNEVIEDIEERGEGIDRRIGRIVDSLAKLKDSESSKTRVSMLKADAAGGLMNMIETYQGERRRLVEQAKKDEEAPLEMIVTLVKKLDERIEARAAQVVKLVESIPGAKDVKKYESAGGSFYGNGWGWTNERISDTWRQNRRDATQAKKARDEAKNALEKSIENLERRRDTAMAQLEREDLTEVEREIQKFELDHVESVLEIRESQLIEVSTPSQEPTQKASRDEADEMKALFEDAAKQLRADFNDNLRLYRLAKEENEKLYALKKNLEAREKWLSENDPEWKSSE
ncbi:MAG: hypothetical protein ACQKBU_01620 [Verrucomicrobiales bacterium]